MLYRVLYCDCCESLRYHSLKILKREKVENGWWMFVEQTCSGVPPIILFHRPRLVKVCGYEERQWLCSSDWMLLESEDIFAA